MSGPGLGVRPDQCSTRQSFAPWWFMQTTVNGSLSSYVKRVFLFNQERRSGAGHGKGCSHGNRTHDVSSKHATCPLHLVSKCTRVKSHQRMSNCEFSMNSHRILNKFSIHSQYIITECLQNSQHTLTTLYGEIAVRIV